MRFRRGMRCPFHGRKTSTAAPAPTRAAEAGRGCRPADRGCGDRGLVGGHHRPRPARRPRPGPRRAVRAATGVAPTAAHRRTASRPRSRRGPPTRRPAGAADPAELHATPPPRLDTTGARRLAVVDDTVEHTAPDARERQAVAEFAAGCRSGLPDRQLPRRPVEALRPQDPRARAGDQPRRQLHARSPSCVATELHDHQTARSPTRDQPRDHRPRAHQPGPSHQHRTTHHDRRERGTTRARTPDIPRHSSGGRPLGQSTGGGGEIGGDAAACGQPTRLWTTPIPRPPRHGGAWAVAFRDVLASPSGGTNSIR